MRLKKLIGNFSWQYALGEILLIFIAINTAIWFNNWNETRKAKNIELKTLLEIKDGLKRDLYDIEENIVGFENRVLLYTDLIDHIENQKPLDDSLRRMLPFIQGITTFLTNSGPYETLKSRGVATITNDSLRVMVANYYDLEYDRILSNERLHHEHHFEYLKPMLMKHFDLKNYSVIPIDYDALINDFEFRQSIYWALRIDSFILEGYKQIKQSGDELTEAITIEEARLQ